MSRRAAGWHVEGRGSSAESFQTKAEAVDYARRRARKTGLGQIVLRVRSVPKRSKG